MPRSCRHAVDTTASTKSDERPRRLRLLPSKRVHFFPTEQAPPQTTHSTQISAQSFRLALEIAAARLRLKNYEPALRSIARPHMNSTGRFPNDFGISVIATRGAADVSPASLSPHARAGVALACSRGRGPSGIRCVTQQLRAGASDLAAGPWTDLPARQSRGHPPGRGSRQFSGEVYPRVYQRQKRRLHSEEMGTPSNTETNFPDPVKFDKERGAENREVAVWDTTNHLAHRY